MSSQTPARHKAEWLVPVVIALGSVVLRAILAHPERVVWGDEPFYLWNARNLVTGRGYTFFNGVPDVYLTPLFPLLAGGLYLLTHNLEFSSRLIYITLGAALVFPVYAIAHEMYGRRTAIIAALVVAVYPTLTAAQLYWGTMTEPLYFFLAYAGVYAALRALRGHSWGAYLAAGALFGLAYLTRGEGIAFIAAVGGMLALIRLSERRLFRWDTFLRLLAMLGAFAVVALPYWIYLRLQTGQWMISGQAGMTYITCISLAYGDAVGFDRATWGLDPTGQEVNFFSPDIVSFSMLSHIRANPGEFARLVYQNVRDFIATLFSSRMFPYWLLPFLALGLFDFAWDRRRFKAELLLLASTAPALSFLFFFVQDRYIGVVLPLMLIWTSHGVDRWIGWATDTVLRLLGERRPATIWRYALAVLPVIALLGVLLLMVPRAIPGSNLGSFRPAHREAGLWLAPRLQVGEVVMSRFPAIAFHAGADWVPTPNAEPAQVIQYARSHRASYFVLDERETIAMRPQLRPLISAIETPGLERLATLERDGSKIVIFRVLP